MGLTLTLLGPKSEGPPEPSKIRPQLFLLWERRNALQPWGIRRQEVVSASARKLLEHSPTAFPFVLVQHHARKGTRMNAIWFCFLGSCLSVRGSSSAFSCLTRPFLTAAGTASPPSSRSLCLLTVRSSALTDSQDIAACSQTSAPPRLGSLPPDRRQLSEMLLP